MLKKVIIVSAILIVSLLTLNLAADNNTGIENNSKRAKSPASSNIQGDNMSNMNHKTATFGGGCFWGVEAVFMEIEGVIETSSGFMGGNTEDPTYKEICYDETNHAEVVEIIYDPNILTYTDLLSVFFSIHDPTTLNRQGPDVGTQYRSAIFYYDDDQKIRALDALEQIEEKKFFDRAVVTEVTKAKTYYKAEDYHQQYFQKKGIAPHCGIGSVNVKLSEPK